MLYQSVSEQEHKTLSHLMW